MAITLNKTEPFLGREFYNSNTKTYHFRDGSGRPVPLEVKQRIEDSNHPLLELFAWQEEVKENKI